MMPKRTGFASYAARLAFVWVICAVLSSPPFAEERKAWLSWQIDNPAWTGMLSGVTFGLWPGEFANDLQRAPYARVDSIVDGALETSRTHAERAFRFWRAFTIAAELAVLTAGFLVWRRRRNRRAALVSPAP